MRRGVCQLGEGTLPVLANERGARMVRSLVGALANERGARMVRSLVGMESAIAAGVASRRSWVDGMVRIGVMERRVPQNGLGLSPIYNAIYNAMHNPSRNAIHNAIRNAIHNAVRNSFSAGRRCQSNKMPVSSMLQISSLGRGNVQSGLRVG